MEHPCAQCGTVVEDGKPFCPQCRAPQVRVPVATSSLEDASTIDSQEPHLAIPDSPSLDQANPDSAQDQFFRATPRTGFRTIGQIDRRIAVRSAIQAGIVGILISRIPFIGIMLTGALAVYLYRRASGTSLQASSGSRLGGAAGAVSLSISSLFMTIRIFFFNALPEYQEAMLKAAQVFGFNPSDPEIHEMIHQLSTPSGLAIALLFSLVIGVALAAIGGALASALLHPRPRA